ncbi:MAG: 1-acyl-sn-glycerol-3-phosphate acyltransferase [Deltaproteobacteria bacterium]|nr:1-acyl-sn-glycerol-3-phosphate acyltransferase [Deltaproteobacteria bacterium]
MKIIFYWVLYPLIRPFYLIFLILNTLVLGTIVILISPLDRKGNFVHYIGKFWSLMNIFLSGTRIKITGQEKIQKNQSYIVISNHQSLFDVWALIGKIPLQLRWIVKLEIRKMPIFGYALERMGHIYINRKTRSAAASSLEKAARKIKGGTSVIIFPEGTRSKDGHLLRFRRGGGIIALKSGVPILPVTVIGSRFVLPKDTLNLMPGKIEVIVGDIIDPGQFDENRIDDLMDTVKSAIEKNLDLDYGKFA